MRDARFRFQRHVLALALALVAVGYGLLFWAAEERGAAQAELRVETERVLSRTRELDRISGPLGSGGEAHDAAVGLLRDLVRDADDPGERAALEQARRCLSSTACAGSAPAKLEEVRQAQVRRLERAWQTSRQKEGRSSVLLGLGLFLGLGGGAYLGARALRWRSTAPASGEAAPEDANAELEALLLRRLEILYATQRDKLDGERFAFLGEVAAGLSHALKTPLCGIRAAAQVAQRKIGAEHAAARHLSDILAEVDGMVDRVRKLLGATGVAELRSAQVRPADLLGDLGRKQKDAGARGLELCLEVEGEPPAMCADRVLLGLALENLIDNALEAAPRGSTVRVVLRLALGSEPADSVEPAPQWWVEVEVEDRGPGIPREVAAGRKMVSAKPEGSGVGVAIARRIVLRHGGTLAFELSPAGGTVARVRLPALVREGLA